MGIKELLDNKRQTAFSFEVLPPLKGGSIDQLYSNIDQLSEFDPLYVNITTHRSEFVFRETENGLFERKSIRRRPGTVAVAAAIHNRYDITVVPHILCSGYTKDDIEYMLLDLQFLGITNLLLLRGDKAHDQQLFVPEKNGWSHAIELAEQVNQFNGGHFIDGSNIKAPVTPFHYGVACYPEKHEEAPNIDSDIYWLKKKVDAGAEFVVTQMFFDNKKYFDFVDRARQEGITVPIVPGIKPFSRLQQLNLLPKTFKVDLPQELATEVAKCTTDEQARALGIEWCAHQCKELIEGGVKGIHFYTVGAVSNVCEVARQIY